MPYYTLVQTGCKVFETLTSHLSPSSLIAMRENVAGVDIVNFYELAKLFVRPVNHLISGGIKCSSFGLVTSFVNHKFSRSCAAVHEKFIHVNNVDRPT